MIVVPIAIRLGLAGSLASFLLGSSPCPAAEEPLRPVRALNVVGNFVGKKNGQVGKDLSGIFCIASSGAGGQRACMAVNDENRTAQAVVLRPDGTLVVGQPVKLIGSELPKNILGRAPQPPCPVIGDLGEYDGEGVAADGEHFYVVGSHGCSRKKGEFRLSSFLLARFDASASPAVELTFRLSDMLRGAARVAPYFGRDLMTANGLNVEGIAAVGGRLYAGLRAPSLDGKAFIVGANVADLFAFGDAPLGSAPEVLELELGPNVGIRDLAALPNNQLLVLSGPAQEQEDVPYALGIVSTEGGRFVTRPKLLAPVMAADGKPAKAEAATPMEILDGKLGILVLFDGISNGGPRVYELPSVQ